jgi:hypothetical protein
MFKCTKCSEEKPESLFVQIKGKRVGMVCRVCRSNQIVSGRKNREEIEKRLSDRLALVSSGKAKCSKCGDVKDDLTFLQKDGKRHGSVCNDCTAELKKMWHARTEQGQRAKRKEEESRERKRLKEERIAKRIADSAASVHPYGSIKCAICSIEKSNTEFSIVNGKRHGKRCLQCATTATKAFREKRLSETPDLHRASRSHEANMRRAGFAKRIPPWADKDAIAAIYAGRPAGHHVDHAIPLFGKFVSGLHVANNLQYLTAKENMKKNRSFTP